jgi:hypothetical protein
MAYRVSAVRIGYPNVALEYRPSEIVTIWATSGKERASGEVSVPESAKVWLGAF